MLAISPAGRRPVSMDKLPEKRYNAGRRGRKISGSKQMSDESLHTTGETGATPFSSTTSEQDVIIRRAREDDVPLLFDMLRKLAAVQGEESRVRISEDALLRDGFGSHPRFEALMAEKNGMAVGMAIFQETYSTWSGAHGLFITDMFVDEAQRGAGVGYGLVRRVAQETAARGMSRLDLNVIHANPARNFYDRMGFTHLDNLLNYRLSDEAFAELAHEDVET